MASGQAPQPADYDSDADTIDKELDWLIENEEEKVRNEVYLYCRLK